MGKIVEVGNLSLASVVLLSGPVVNSSNIGLPRVILSMGKIVEVGNLSLASVVLLSGPVVHSFDFINPCAILTIELALYFVQIINSRLVIFNLLLLQRFYLIFP